jgi:hypothetical protein
MLVFIFSYAIFQNSTRNKCVKIFSGDQPIVPRAWEDIRLFIFNYLSNIRIYCSTLSYLIFPSAPNLLSRVYGFVTNNNGFWTGWLELLTISFTFSLNHNQLQQLTINDCPRLAPFSFSSPAFPFFHNCQLQNSTLFHPLCTDATENTACIVNRLFTVPLPSNRSPIVPRVCFCGNVFSDPLPNNGHVTDWIENNSCNTFSVVACGYFGRCLEMGLTVTIFSYFCGGYSSSTRL